MGGFRYMVGVVAPGSTSMTLHEVDGIHVSSEVDGIYKDLPAIETNTMTNFEKKIALIKGFGAAKKKRELASMLAGKVTDDKIDDMDDVKASISARAKELGMAPSGSNPEDAELEMMKQLLPPFDMTATSAQLIYDGTHIVPEAIL